MSAPADLYSVIIVDTSKKSSEPIPYLTIRSHIIDYFNLGINEYKYPEGTELGDTVQTVVRDLNVTDSGLTSVPYETVGEGVEGSQAIFVIADRTFDPAVTGLLDRYRNDHYIDFMYV